MDFRNHIDDNHNIYQRIDKEVGEKSKFLETNYNAFKDIKVNCEYPKASKELAHQHQYETSDNSNQRVFNVNNQKSPKFSYNDYDPRFACDYSIDHEQQSSKFCIPPDTEDTPSPRKHISQEKFPKIKQTPLRKVFDKSPIMDKDETEELFKSFNSRHIAKDADISDSSYSKLKMINPLDKSGFTPGSICRSGNKSSLRT